MSLSSEFAHQHAGELVTTKQCMDWYISMKGGNKHAYRSNMYETIIYPLLRTGMMIKHAPGVYQVISDEAQKDLKEVKLSPFREVEQDDEFDRYLKEKLTI